jgi:tRNA nucleotidyltransferase (CCA-adding enzyme)
LKRIFPEVDALFGIPQPEQWHPEIDTGVHTLMHCEWPRSCRAAKRCASRCSCTTWQSATPLSYYRGIMGTSNAPTELLERLCARLPVPNRFRDLALLVARHHGTVHKAAELKPQTVLRLITAADGLRQPERFDEMLLACEPTLGPQGARRAQLPTGRLVTHSVARAKAVDAGKVKAETARRRSARQSAA